MGPTTVTTDCFRISPGIYLRYTARSVVPRLALAICVPFIACCIAAVWDLRWAFVALILIFLVAPMIVGYIYFSRLLTPQARKALSPQKVTLPDYRSNTKTECQLTVTYISADDENTPPSPVSFPWNNVQKITETRKYLIIEADALGYPLIIPKSSLTNETQI